MSMRQREKKIIAAINATIIGLDEGFDLEIEGIEARLDALEGN